MRDSVRKGAICEGCAESHAEGLADGEARYSKLVSMLLSTDRYRDLQRAAKDPTYRDELFEELN